MQYMGNATQVRRIVPGEEAGDCNRSWMACRRKVRLRGLGLGAVHLATDRRCVIFVVLSARGQTAAPDRLMLKGVAIETIDAFFRPGG
jgi:hypothetical protein